MIHIIVSCYVNMNRFFFFFFFRFRRPDAVVGWFVCSISSVNCRFWLYVIQGFINFYFFLVEKVAVKILFN